MVMLTIRLKRIRLDIPASRKARVAAPLRKEFGGSLTITTKPKGIWVEGDRLGDYRVRERVYNLATGKRSLLRTPRRRKNGANSRRSPAS